MLDSLLDNTEWPSNISCDWSISLKRSQSECWSHKTTFAFQRRQQKLRISTKCPVHGRAIDIMNINDVYGPSRRQAHCAACQRGGARPIGHTVQWQIHHWRSRPWYCHVIHRSYQGNRKLRARSKRCVAFTYLKSKYFLALSLSHANTHLHNAHTVNSAYLLTLWQQTLEADDTRWLKLTVLSRPRAAIFVVLCLLFHANLSCNSWQFFITHSNLHRICIDKTSHLQSSDRKLAEKF